MEEWSKSYMGREYRASVNHHPPKAGRAAI
jgi:hypothetical protein